MLALFLAAFALAAPLGTVRRATLDNGLVVLLAEDHSLPLVCVASLYRVGARHEAAGTTGLAHYVEHMNFRSTRRFPGSKSTEAVTRLGGRWTGYTWIEQTYYAQTVPRAALGLALDVERERMSEAMYAPAEFEKERTSVLAELRSYDDPASVLYDAVLATSFEIHPYRHNTIGWRKDVEGVTRDEAWSFYRRHYQPANAVLVVVGDMDADSALAEVRARFAMLPAGASLVERAAEPPQRGEKRVVVRQPGPQARVLLAFRAPAVGDPDFAGMVLFDALLAGGKGFRFTRSYPPPARTLLADAVAGAGLSAETETDWQASREPYVYTVAASLAEKEKLADAEAALFRALTESAERAWSPEELEAARRQVRTGWASDLDDLPGRAHQLAFFEALGGHERVLEMPEQLARAGLDDVRRFARRWLGRDRVTVGWFEPLAEAVAAASPPPPPPAATTPAPTATAPRPAVAAPTSMRLRNGLRVALEPTASAGLVALRGRVDAGSAFDGPRPGLSALATELLAAAPVEASAPPLTFTLHADPTDGTSVGWIEFTAACLSEDAPALLRSVGARLARAAAAARALGEEEWSRAREAAARRLRAREADAEAFLWQRARAELYPAGSPLAAPPWGLAASLQAASREELQAFLAGHVTPGRTRLVLAGRVDGITAARLEEWLGAPDAPAPVAPGPPSAVTAKSPSVWTERAFEWPGKDQDDILVVWPGERSRPWDRAATALMLYLLGETGYAGRLGRALVEPGLVYHVVATLEEPGAANGFLAVRTAAAPGDRSETLRRVRHVLEEAARGAFEQRELEEAKAYLRGKRARARDGSVAAAQAAAEAPAAGPRGFEAVTLEQLRDTARRLAARGAPLALVITGRVPPASGSRPRAGTIPAGGGRSRTSRGREGRAAAVGG